MSPLLDGPDNSEREFLEGLRPEDKFEVEVEEEPDDDGTYYYESGEDW